MEHTPFDFLPYIRTVTARIEPVYTWMAEAWLQFSEKLPGFWEARRW
jgi:hypothetical protein